MLSMLAIAKLERFLLFHVKRLQTEEAAINLFIDISEVQQVGSEGANTQGNRKHANRKNVGFTMPTQLHFPEEDYRVYETEGPVVEGAGQPAEFPKPETFP